MTKYPMPTIAGVINMTSGILALIGFILLFIFSIAISIPVIELNGCGFGVDNASGILFLISIMLLIIGILSIFGGVRALRRKNWRWALTGSICALIPNFPLGIVSIILVVLSKDDFEKDAKYERDIDDE
jgi:uncharacterized BrkB/YihY/UPF0761 family membrane protein